MRNLFSSFTLSVLFFFVITNIYAHTDLTGYWYSDHLSTSIKIKDKEEVLFVKGLDGSNRIQVFDRINARSYEDQWGNRFIVDDCNAIYFIASRGHRHKRIFFEKIARPGYDRSTKRHKRQPSYFEEEVEDHNKNNYNKNYDNNSKDYSEVISKWTNYEQKVSGTWRPTNDYTSIVIIDTREGLKAKFSGTSNWVSYIQSKVNPYEFVDVKGNKYVFDGDSKATWISGGNNEKRILMHKISDEHQF